jgi:hypothetical protein
MKIYEEKKKKNKTKKLGRMVTPKWVKKGLFPLEKPLRMTDMCISTVKNIRGEE